MYEIGEDERDGLWAFGKIKLALIVVQAGNNEADAPVEKAIPRNIYTQASSKTSCCSHAWIAKGSMTGWCSIVVLRPGKPQPRLHIF